MTPAFIEAYLIDGNAMWLWIFDCIVLAVTATVAVLETRERP